MRTAWIFTLLAVLPLTASTASAGGQFVGDNGSQPQQRAGAFAAKADDPTAIFHNPAGLALLGSNQLFLGANMINFSQSFQRHGDYAASAGTDQAIVGERYALVSHKEEVQPVPFLAVAFPRKSYTFALGVFAPQGYAKRNYGDTIDMQAGTAPAPQRYDTVWQKGMMVLPSAALAIRASDKLSIGGRASYGFGEFQSRRYVQGLPNAAEDPAQDSAVTVAVKDEQIITFGVGLHYKHSSEVEIGISYTAPININAVGTSNTELGPALVGVTSIEPVADNMAQCAPGGTAGAIKACLDFALPQTATVGMRYVVRDASGDEIGDIEADVKWENWSAVSDYRVVVDGQNTTLNQPLAPSTLSHGFVDVYSVRLGGSTRFVRDGTRYEVRAGLAYDTAATPKSWTRLDVDGGDRVTAAAGLGIWLGEKGGYRLDIGAAFIDSPRRNINNVSIPDPSDPDGRVQPDVTVPLAGSDAPYHPFNAGTYESRYVIGSVGLTASW